MNDHASAARAVYDASAERYVDFAGTEINPATEAAIDRALLAGFIELISDRHNRLVADLGCGPGRVAATLARHSLPVVGVDVSPAILVEAQRAHPTIAVQNARLDQLPVVDRSCAGAVSWYSIIYTPPAHLGAVFMEVWRILEPGGFLLLAFQIGDGEPVARADAFGTGLPLTSYRHEVEDIERHLETAGFHVHATTVRSAELDHEMTPQAFVIARRS